MKTTPQLGPTITSDGNSSVYTLISGGSIYFGVEGSLGGGTLTLYKSLDGTNYSPIVDNITGTTAAISTVGSGMIINLLSCFLRATLAGSTSPSAKIYIGPVRIHKGDM